MRIAIIGGGITGAYLQFKLSAGGYDSVIFEKEDSIGGLLRPFNILGHNITLGPHIYFIDWLELNNINPYIPLKFKEGFILNNKFTSPLSLAVKYPELILSPFKAMRGKYKDARSFFLDIFGKRMTQKIFAPLFLKWLDVPIEKLSHLEGFVTINHDLKKMLWAFILGKSVFANYEGNLAESFADINNVIFEEIKRIERHGKNVRILTDKAVRDFDFAIMTVDLNTQQKLIFGKIKELYPYRHSVFDFKILKDEQKFTYAYVLDEFNRNIRATNYQKLYPDIDFPFISYEMTIGDDELVNYPESETRKILKNSYPVKPGNISLPENISVVGRTAQGDYMQCKDLFSKIDVFYKTLSFIGEA